MKQTEDQIQQARRLTSEEVEALEAELRDAIAEHMRSCQSWSVTTLAAHLARAIVTAVPSRRRLQETYADLQKEQAKLRADIELLRPSGMPPAA